MEKNIYNFFFILKCVIARQKDGIMILVKKYYLIRLIDDNRGRKVKLTIRFFDLKDGVVHTTEKTEIEIDDEVCKFFFIQVIIFSALITNNKFKYVKIITKI